MARRKRNNRRRRRGSFAALYRLLCLALIVGAVAAALALFFKVEHIVVTGNSRYSAEEVVTAGGVKRDDNLYLMNKYDVAGRICGALPYVESVSIKRGLPDTLHIHVTECVCRAAIEQNGQSWILCSSGKITDTVGGSSPEGHTRITGLALAEPQIGAVMKTAEEDEYRRGRLLELLGCLREKNMLADMQEIRLEESECIVLRYLDRLDVEIPWDSDFGYKMDFLLAVVEKLEDYETGTLKMMTDGEARLL